MDLRGSGFAWTPEAPEQRKVLRAGRADGKLLVVPMGNDAGATQADDLDACCIRHRDDRALRDVAVVLRAVGRRVDRSPGLVIAEQLIQLG